jgi:hypothetical protein
MKNMILTVIAVLLLFVVNSCCTKIYCLGADDIYEIEFYNFSQADLDTITILSYPINSNFSISVDSFVTQASKTGDHFSANTKDKLNTNLDYKIKLASTGQVFTLTNFEIEKEGCNSCFPYRPKSDFYNKLNAYQINGQRQSVNQIKIFK